MGEDCSWKKLNFCEWQSFGWQVAILHPCFEWYINTSNFNFWHKNEVLIELYEVELEKHISIHLWSHACISFFGIKFYP